MNEEYNWCFGCGKDNPYGLQLKFSFENGRFVARFNPEKHHQGYNGRVHGGIIASMLDEAMGSYINQSTGKEVYTAQINIRYREAVIVGGEVLIEGELVRQKGRFYEMKGNVYLSDGTLAAEATGKFLEA